MLQVATLVVLHSQAVLQGTQDRPHPPQLPEDMDNSQEDMDNHQLVDTDNQQAQGVWVTNHRHQDSIRVELAHINRG